MLPCRPDLRSSCTFSFCLQWHIPSHIVGTSYDVAPQFIKKQTKVHFCRLCPPYICSSSAQWLCRIGEFKVTKPKAAFVNNIISLMHLGFGTIQAITYLEPFFPNKQSIDHISQFHLFPLVECLISYRLATVGYKSQRALLF